MKNKHPFAVFYTVILIAATVWSLLDTFVVADKIAVVDESLANTSIYAQLQTESAAGSVVSAPANVAAPTAVSEVAVVADTTVAIAGSSAPTAVVSEPTTEAAASTDLALISNPSEQPIVTDRSYQDAHIQITIETIHQYNTDIYIADVVVSDVAYLKSALANNTYGKNIKQTTSAMAAAHSALLAINGDYYGFRSAGFVIRNGVLYRSTARSGSSQALVVDADGGFTIIEESSSDAQSLYDQGALQVFSFGPALIQDGAISVTSNSEVSQSMNSNPRTAIGMVAPLHYVFVVSDGRTAQSAGLSLLQLAQVMQDYGCTVAYNLDGGGSSTMVFNGEIINNPTDGRSYGERKVSDIIYIGDQL
ncbi:MAG: phosphodiester glycosidase family protein [Caldilineales bacterium]